MKSQPQEASAKAWDDFMEIRVGELEAVYESLHVTDLDKAMLEKLRRTLSQALGPEKAALLYTYTDRLIAVYNRDGDWFYRKGWQDALHSLGDVPASGLDLEK